MLIPHSHLSAGLLDRSDYFFVRFGVRYNQCRMYRTPYINVYFIHVLRGYMGLFRSTFFSQTVSISHTLFEKKKMLREHPKDVLHKL
jgi:hypothetical protein